jgi:anti-sigma regulatory factor (Ser/Thr protein kinase)
MMNSDSNLRGMVVIVVNLRKETVNCEVVVRENGFEIEVDVVCNEGFKLLVMEVEGGYGGFWWLKVVMEVEDEVS